MTRRVVITGLGLDTPIGTDVASATRAVREGKSGVRRMPEWDVIADLQCRIGAPIDGLDLVAHYPRRKRRTMGLVAMLAAHASEQAVAQAGLDERLLSSGRTGLAYGSTSGSSVILEDFCGPLFIDKAVRGLDSTSYLKFMTHTCVANLAQFFQVRGRILPTCSACTSGSQAIGFGYETIQHGLQDVMICGGADELHYATAVTFDLLMATSTRHNDDPANSPRPFDVQRDGLVIGEGAGTVVLEALDHALGRGAQPLAEVIGFGTNCDGLHVTAPSQEGMREALRLGLESARVRPDEVDYVNAHGTATDLGDVAESQATFDVFGRAVPFSSLKGHMGHTLGACGAIEVVLCVQMMRERFLAATRNLRDVDPRCAPLGYVKETTSAAPRTILSSNFAFGGVNTALVLRAFEP